MIAIEALRDLFKERMATVCSCGHARFWHLDVSRIDLDGIACGGCLKTTANDEGRVLSQCKCSAFVERK